MKAVIRYCVNHSLFVNLVSVFLLVAGILCLVATRREAFPNINFDVVTVRTDYFGSPPGEVEKLVTIPLEDELKEVNGIDEMTSVSSENISMLIIKLDPNEQDKTKIVNDIQRAVDRVDDLPEDAEDPIVEELQTKNMPVINVSLSGDFSEVELQKLARRLEVELLDLSSIARIDRVGWRDREIWVEIKPSVIDEYKLSLEDVILGLKNKNLNLPGGTLNTEKGDYLVRTVGEFESPDEIRKVIIRANDSGNWIRVQDIGDVIDTFEDNNVLEKTRGHKAITLTIIKKEKGDIISLVEDVRRISNEFKEQGPAELEVSYFDDMSYYVKRRQDVLLSNGVIGLILVVLSLLIFLTRTAAIMTALGVLVALSSTFFAMYVFGLTINLITMFALIMVLGMIVDDAIIIAENVYRYLEEGMSPHEAAITGTSEVAAPVIATVLTTVVAFVPLMFMSGIMGKYISVIPVVVILALGASLAEALFVLPAHLADFSKKMEQPKKQKKENPWFENLKNAYVRVLDWMIHHRYIAVGFFVLAAVFAVFLFVSSMRFVLFPQGLIEEFYIKAKAPIGTSLIDMEKLLDQVGDAVDDLSPDELDNFITQIGLQRDGPDDAYTDRGTHMGQVHIFLTPEKTKGRRHVDKIIEELRTKLQPLSEQFEELTYDKVKSGPPVGKPVSIRLRGDEFEMLKKVSVEIQKQLSQMEGVKDIRDDYEEGKKEIRIIVDEEKATTAGLTIRDIAMTMRNSLEGNEATKIRKTDEEIEVIVRFPEEHRKSEKIFDYIQIPNHLGNLIPVKKVARLENTTGVHAIKHFDRKRMIAVTADVDEKIITPIDIEGKIQKFYNNELVQRYPGLNLSFGGEQEETQKSLQDFLRAMFLAVFLIFIILAASFNSIIRPIVVMCAIPFGLVGVIYAFFLHGQPLSFMALLGTIGLSGVVVNDSIVLVSFIYSERQRGVERFESIRNAGRVRLRPVILTTITTVAGLMPVAYGLGGNDPFLKPMALAVSWGLFFATVLTLLLIPCLYAISDDLSDFFQNLFHRKKIKTT
jgi:multidrug efflux pump subunit AcrB